MGNRLTGLSGGDGQGSSTFSDTVPSLNRSLEVGGRPISEAGLVGGLSKLSTHLTLACLFASCEHHGYVHLS